MNEVVLNVAASLLSLERFAADLSITTENLGDHLDNNDLTLPLQMYPETSFHLRAAAYDLGDNPR